MMTGDERLAVLVAMDKQIAPALKEAKEQARLELLDAFDETHADRRAIIVGEDKVGEVGISYSAPRAVISAGREDEAVAALRELGLTEEVPAKGWEKAFAQVGGVVVNKETGERAEWAYWQGRAPKTAVVRGCKPEDVVAAMGPRMSGVDVAGLIAGEVG